MISKFNGTSTPKGSYRAKTGDNDCNVYSSRYSLRAALCESIRYQAKSEQDVRQDPIPRVRHGEAALCTKCTWQAWLPIHIAVSHMVTNMPGVKPFYKVCYLTITIQPRQVAKLVPLKTQKGKQRSFRTNDYMEEKS